MSRKYKLDVTRPEFLLQMMSDGDVDRLDEDSMHKVLHEASELSYVVYTVLMETDPKKCDIIKVSNDGEAIAIQFASKSQAKNIGELCNGETVRFGKSHYEVKAKVRDKYVIFSATELECEDGGEEDIDE
ncbi:MAG: hypothetical protein K2F99_01555 [Muribaculaceae bacterium]|nr:hypothetical protein [Muribaculaceae bacterium]